MGDDLADRYSRQAAFPEIGQAGQERIQAAKLLLVGVGALGSHVATQLVRAGIGSITLVDRDIVEVSNLQRQLLYTESDAREGRPKATAAKARLEVINSSCRIHACVEDFDAELFASLPERPDLILDGTDNFSTRYLINDLSARDSIPWIYAGAVAATARAMAVIPGSSPCLRCLVPDPPAAAELGTCETIGALGPAIAMAAAFQAAQALRILSGHAPAQGMFTADVWTGESALRLKDHPPRPDCETCGHRIFPSLRQVPHETIKLCGRNAIQVRPPRGIVLDLQRLAAQIGKIAPDLVITRELLRFTVEGHRISVFRGGRALLFGVSEPERARILYDRYIGST